METGFTCACKFSSFPVKWTPEIVKEPSPESRAERQVQKELVAVGVEGRNEFDDLLEKFSLRKAMRIGAWISRFLRNCCRPSSKIRGPLTAAELAEHELFWIKRAQKKGMSNKNFIADQVQINLQQNKHGVVVYREIIPSTCQIQSFLQLRWFSMPTSLHSMGEFL